MADFIVKATDIEVKAALKKDEYVLNEDFALSIEEALDELTEGGASEQVITLTIRRA